VRDNLEKAIAVYVATAQRPTVSIKTGAITIFPDNTIGMPIGLVSHTHTAFECVLRMRFVCTLRVWLCMWRV
jgi:hypothetical protein